MLWLTLWSLASGPAHALPADLRVALEDGRARSSPAAPVLQTTPGDRKTDAGRVAGQGAIRFAVTRPMVADLVQHARWQTLSDGRAAGQVRVLAPTAASISLELSQARLPPGAEVWLDAADGTDARIRPLTNAHADGGKLHTPLVRGDDLLVTIVVPPGVDAPVLHLEAAHVGVMPFGRLPPPPQGGCNVDVVCPESAGWEAEVATVGVYAVDGDFWCTGFMLNNTAEDQTPYFATADHCGLRSSNVADMTVYWNYESEDCGDLSGGPLDDWQHGATFRMDDRDSDWTLVELDDAPDPEWEVAWAGWDRSGNTTSGAVTIHHPGTDEKAISFENDPTTVTEAYSDRSDSNGTHVRVDDWDLGTTEGGSSGSPLFDTDHRVIGALTGGDAACGNDDPDWYGRLYSAWDASSSSSGRLSDWLDPLGTGQTTVDTLAPSLSGVRIAPLTGWSGSGPQGGPFTSESAAWQLQNNDDTERVVSVAIDVPWATPSSSSIPLSASSDDTLTVQTTADAESLEEGRYSGTLTVTVDDGSDPTDFDVALLVGTSEVLYSWNLDTDPGWDTEGEWEWGVPEGRGGSTGGSDPSSGYTGDHVYGYNLGGDYQDRQRAMRLTADSFDLTGSYGATLHFQRWLGVEEAIYDNADVQVSTDGGATWSVLWANSGEVNDRGWVDVELPLGADSDNRSDVRVRWSMGATDEGVRYCGWNIDDIEVHAILTDASPGPEPEDTGTPEDTAEPGPDTAEPETDSGPDADSGTTDTDVPTDKIADDGKVSGCACSSGVQGAAGSALLWGIVGLAAVRRRD